MSREISEGYRCLSLNFANEGIKIAAARADFDGPKYSGGSICQRRLSPTPKSFAHVRSLVERKTNHAFALPSSSPFSTKRGKDHAQSSSAKVVSNRAERSSDHSHIYKPTGRTAWKLQARDVLSWLVLSAGHDPKGDGKIAATKLAWASSRETLFPRFHIQVRARTKGTDVRHVGIAVKSAWNTHWREASRLVSIRIGAYLPLRLASSSLTRALRKRSIVLRSWFARCIVLY